MLLNLRSLLSLVTKESITGLFTEEHLRATTKNIVFYGFYSEELIEKKLYSHVRM